MLQFNVFSVLLIISALATGVLATLLLNRTGLAGRNFAWMMYSLSIWAAAYAFELTAVRLDSILFWLNIEYLGIAMIPAFWITFTFAFTGREHWLTPRNVAIIFAIPVLTILIVWTNPWHHLHYATYGVAPDTPFPMLSFTRGPWYLVHLYYFYILLILGVTLLMRYYNIAAPIYRKQTIVVLAGVLIPWFVNALYHLGFRPYEYLDMTPVVFTASGLAIGLGLLRFKLFDIVPVARDKVVEGLNEGVMVLDNLQRVVYCNTKMQEYLFPPGSDIIGKDFAELPAHFIRIRKLLGKEEATSMEIELVLNRPSRITVEVTATRLSSVDRASAGTLLLFRDITERKKNEQELVMARIRAEESDRLKSAFLANMSHEIRNPMNGIIGFAGILKDHELPETERNEYLGIIEDNAEQLLAIINDIIDISKIEAGHEEVRMSGFSVRNLLANVEKSVQPQAAHRGLYFSTHSFLEDYEDFVLSDPLKIRQILTNLLDNALKFTPEGSVSLRANIIDGLLVFSIKDSGKGIEADHLNVIFDRFQQLDQDNQYISRGTGLGLAISRGYAHLLGGELTVTSLPGKGSTFFLKLPHVITDPDETPQTISMSATSLPAPDWSGKKIILAEDEPVNIMYMKIALKKTNVTLIIAETGQAAVEAYQANPDATIVLLDIKMPVMDGFEAARKIRDLGCTAPLVALSGHAMLENDRIEGAGFVDLIAKPVRKEDLINKLRTWLD